MHSQPSRSHTRMKAATDPMWTSDRIFELEAENERLREALKVASEDLHKAANQCEGLHLARMAAEGVEPPPPSISAARFTEKAERAAAVALTGKQESDA